MEAVVQVCKKHGEARHAPVIRNGVFERYRCCKCRVDAVTKRRRKLKLMAVDYKGGCCVQCGYNKSVSALEFHHLDPSQKDFAIGNQGVTRSWASVKDELDKCILVCANCHREIHAEEE